MTPLELIKEGIAQANWMTVCDGYEALTGEHLHAEKESHPQTYRIVLEQIYDLVANAFEEPGYVPTTTILDTTKTTKIPKKKKSGRKKKVKRPKSTSEDEEDGSLILDSSKITPVKFEQGKIGKSQLITNESNLEEVKRNRIRASKTTKTYRGSPKKYQATCSECLKKFESDRKSGEIGQMCHNCLQGKKSRFNG